MLTSVDDINPALPYLLRTLNYGIMVYSLLWVLQDLYHPPYNDAQTRALISEVRYTDPTGIWEFPKIRGTLFWGPYNKDPTI